MRNRTTKRAPDQKSKRALQRTVRKSRNAIRCHDADQIDGKRAALRFFRRSPAATAKRAVEIEREPEKNGAKMRLSSVKNQSNKSIEQINRTNQSNKSNHGKRRLITAPKTIICQCFGAQCGWKYLRIIGQIVKIHPMMEEETFLMKNAVCKTASRRAEHHNRAHFCAKTQNLLARSEDVPAQQIFVL